MKKWTSTLIAGGSLTLLTNAVVLLGAAYNRSDEAESLLKLSQRELQNHRWSANKDNSGITLTMNWRIESEKATLQNDYGMGYSSGKWGRPEWLNQGKMVALGFDVDKLVSSADFDRRRKEALPREALLVLELNDKAYQQELQRARDYAAQAKELLAKNPDKEEFKGRAKRTSEILKSEEQTNSRLFAIDAGNDLTKLRATYPDRTRYAIVRGLIYPSISREKNKTSVGGHIREVNAEKINVPFIYRNVFGTSTTPYEVSVAFGKRLEPWITAATKTVAAK
jgi:hypothetical protein